FTVLNAPITGGNVSFYNETFGEDIYPTPVIGVVGLIEDLRLVTPSAFRDAEDSILLVETVILEVGRVNLDEERALQHMVSKAIGAEITVPSQMEVCRDLFGVYTSRIIVSTTKASEIKQQAESAGLRCTLLGKVGGDRLILNYEGIVAIDIAMDELETAWRQG